MSGRGRGFGGGRGGGRGGFGRGGGRSPGGRGRGGGGRFGRDEGPPAEVLGELAVLLLGPWIVVARVAVAAAEAVLFLLSIEELCDTFILSSLITPSLLFTGMMHLHICYGLHHSLQPHINIFASLCALYYTKPINTYCELNLPANTHLPSYILLRKSQHYIQRLARSYTNVKVN